MDDKIVVNSGKHKEPSSTLFQKGLDATANGNALKPEVKTKESDGPTLLVNTEFTGTSAQPLGKTYPQLTANPSIHSDVPQDTSSKVPLGSTTAPAPAHTPGEDAASRSSVSKTSSSADKLKNVDLVQLCKDIKEVHKQLEQTNKKLLEILQTLEGLATADPAIQGRVDALKKSVGKLQSKVEKVERNTEQVRQLLPHSTATPTTPSSTVVQNPSTEKNEKKGPRDKLPTSTQGTSTRKPDNDDCEQGLQKERRNTHSPGSEKLHKDKRNLDEAEV